MSVWDRLLRRKVQDEPGPAFRSIVCPFDSPVSLTLDYEATAPAEPPASPSPMQLPKLVTPRRETTVDDPVEMRVCEGIRYYGPRRGPEPTRTGTTWCLGCGERLVFGMAHACGVPR